MHKLTPSSHWQIKKSSFDNAHQQMGGLAAFCKRISNVFLGQTVLIQQVWPSVQHGGETPQAGLDDVMAGLDVFPDVERGKFSLAEVTHHGLAKIMNFSRVGGICWAFWFLILTDIIVLNILLLRLVWG